jgi:TRAP-type C4-dicarboxylate transport system permease small subunit
LIAHLDKIVSHLAGLTLAAFTAVILLEVVCRYWLHIALSWPSEASILLFQWMVFLAAPVALRQGLHFTVDALVVTLPEVMQRILAVLAAAVALATGITLAFYGYRMILRSWDTTYPTLPVSAATPFIGLALSGVLIGLFALQSLVEQGRKASTP